jgi:hypothetical protein
MRTSWLIAIAVGLAGSTALGADVVIGYQPPPGAPTVATGPPAGAPCVEAYPPGCKPSVRDRLRGLAGRPACCESPCATAPHQPAACAEGKKGCKSCGGGCDGRSFCERLKAWLCYQPVQGCCDKTACGCRPAPLYAYFLDDCAQGPGCAQAPACCEKPGLWRRLCDSGHKLFASPAGHGCGAGVGCPSGSCGVR